ncbi:MAG: orotidine-5'-phosphate decarboxylase [Rhodospirillales bacterium]
MIAPTGMILPHERVLVGIDTTDCDKAVGIANAVAGSVGGVKLGKEFFVSNGPEGVRCVTAGGAPLFLDLKWHDIPNTVAGAVRASLPLKPLIVNVHASGGPAMMRAAAEAAAAAGTDRPMVIGVTVLTSMAEDDLAAVGQDTDMQAQVARLAKLAMECGLDGVVCSPKEIRLVKQACGPDFKCIVPGIRPVWSAANDQKRIATPSQAVLDGADYIVIGRPIAAAEDPANAAKRVAEELEAA